MCLLDSRSLSTPPHGTPLTTSSSNWLCIWTGIDSCPCAEGCARCPTVHPESCPARDCDPLVRKQRTNPLLGLPQQRSLQRCASSTESRMMVAHRFRTTPKIATVVLDPVRQMHRTPSGSRVGVPLRAYSLLQEGSVQDRRIRAAPDSRASSSVGIDCASPRSTRATCALVSTTSIYPG